MGFAKSAPQAEIRIVPLVASRIWSPEPPDRTNTGHIRPTLVRLRPIQESPVHRAKRPNGDSTKDLVVRFTPLSAFVLRRQRERITLPYMKSLTVRLPDSLLDEITTESRGRRISKSDVIRERLQRGGESGQEQPDTLAGIADLIGSVDGLPADLSARAKHYLRATEYGR